MNVVWDRVDLQRLDQFTSLLAQHATAMLRVGLVGTLGAGKTRFVQSVAQQIRINVDEVTSPTFTLVQSYRGEWVRGTVELHHVDAYRIADEDEWLETGLEELLDDGEQSSSVSWCFVEWADRFEVLMPASTLWIQIDLTTSECSENEPTRRITVSTNDNRHDSLIEVLRRHA